MRHRAPRRLLAVVRRPGEPLHRHLGSLTARPSARMVGAMSAVLLLLTGGMAVATVLYDGARAGDPSADRLRSALRPSRSGDRTPPPSAPTPTLERRQTEASPAPSRGERPARTAVRASHTPRPTRPTRSESIQPRPSQILPTRTSLPTAADLPDSPTDTADRVTRSPTQDVTAPQTRVVSGPSEEDEDTPLEFTASEAATFDCSLDDGPFRSCSSPEEYDDVGAGWHTVEVRAVDASGNRDATPDAWRWHAESANEHDDDQEQEDEGPVERLLPDGDLAP